MAFWPASVIFPLKCGRFYYAQGINEFEGVPVGYSVDKFRPGSGRVLIWHPKCKSWFNVGLEQVDGEHQRPLEWQLSDPIHLIWLYPCAFIAHWPTHTLVVHLPPSSQATIILPFYHIFIVPKLPWSEAVSLALFCIYPTKPYSDMWRKGEILI